MADYKLIIFDLDGTLADTSLGINASHKLAIAAMGKNPPTDEELVGVIGGPLFSTYSQRFGFSDEDAFKTVKLYREFYSQKCIDGSELYPKMKEILCTLKKRGYLLAVATLKAEYQAKKILEALNISECFDVIHGVNTNDKLTKSDLVELCMNELCARSTESVLVGDSIHDGNGATNAGVSFIACTYGFGFKTENDAADFKPYKTISSPELLLDIFN